MSSPTLDIEKYLLRFGVLGMFLGSKDQTSGGVWMSRAIYPKQPGFLFKAQVKNSVRIEVY